MAVLVFLAGAAKRYVMQDRNIVLDHRGLAHHKAGGVVEENAAADFRCRIDVALKHRRSTALQIEREILAALAVQPMRQAMRLDGVEAFVIEHRLDEAAGGRIAIDGGDDIGTEGFAERRLVLKRVVIGLADQVGGYVGVVEPLADAMRDRCLERVVVQNVFVDKGGELRLAARDVFRFAADARPDRIDFVEGPCGPCLILSHTQILPTPLVSPR